MISHDVAGCPVLFPKFMTSSDSGLNWAVAWWRLLLLPTYPYFVINGPHLGFKSKSGRNFESHYPSLGNTYMVELEVDLTTKSSHLLEWANPYPPTYEPMCALYINAPDMSRHRKRNILPELLSAPSSIANQCPVSLPVLEFFEKLVSSDKLRLRQSLQGAWTNASCQILYASVPFSCFWALGGAN